ncbi:unnamed protein product [Staurois parvus]|uniref:Small ribosomal subunit protein bS6m n=1 Tax=Staurois parvus TaxID=386267 RepID=A0ABN9HPG4_9NEOB|nr:unnamed protein product [Staurois parvus]
MEALFERGAIIRNLESLGEKNLPFRMSKHSQYHSRGGYFLVDFYAPPTVISNFLDHLSRDTDIIRPTILKHEEEKRPETSCTGMVPPNLEEKFRTRKRK